MSRHFFIMNKLIKDATVGKNSISVVNLYQDILYTFFFFIFALHTHIKSICYIKVIDEHSSGQHYNILLPYRYEHCHVQGCTIIRIMVRLDAYQCFLFQSRIFLNLPDTRLLPLRHLFLYGIVSQYGGNLYNNEQFYHSLSYNSWKTDIR